MEFLYLVLFIKLASYKERPVKTKSYTKHNLQEP